jgi:hypothetical protein
VLSLILVRRRIDAFIEEIERLREIEFPYPDSQRLLTQVLGRFRQLKTDLSRVQEDFEETLLEQGNTSLTELYRYLPVLGFILRSTDVRSPFEVFGPLRRIARNLLEPGTKEPERKTRLLLSSEWDYAPTFRHDKAMRDYVIIGLPAHEASNPLLLPLCGHEFGHALWIRNNLEPAFKGKIDNSIAKLVADRWEDAQERFPQLKDTKSADPTLIPYQTVFNIASTWATRQAEETFCDFVGLRLFARAYVMAYAYLLFPGNIGARLSIYPNSQTRVQNMEKAMAAYRAAAIESEKIPARPNVKKNDRPKAPKDTQTADPAPAAEVGQSKQRADYYAAIPDLPATKFSDRPESDLLAADKFRLKLADDALNEVVPDLIDEAKKLVDNAGIEEVDPAEVARIRERYRKIVPASKCVSLVDILNAGWEALEDPKLWENERHVRDRKEGVLRELLLKNIEFLAVEQIEKDAYELPRTRK